VRYIVIVIGIIVISTIRSFAIELSKEYTFCSLTRIGETQGNLLAEGKPTHSLLCKTGCWLATKIAHDEIDTVTKLSDVTMEDAEKLMYSTCVYACTHPTKAYSSEAEAYKDLEKQINACADLFQR